MKLVLLTQPNCSGCELLKQKLDREGLLEKTEKVDVSIDRKAIEKYAIMSTPVLVLEDEDSEVTRIIGYTPKQEQDVDDLIQYI